MYSSEFDRTTKQYSVLSCMYTGAGKVNVVLTEASELVFTELGLIVTSPKGNILLPG